MPTTCPNQIAHETLSCQPQEAAMSIIRLIHINIDPTEMERALQVWKTECAPLMIQQVGCISEKLLTHVTQTAQKNSGPPRTPARRILCDQHRRTVAYSVPN